MRIFLCITHPPSGGAAGIDLCSGSLTDILALFLSQFYSTYASSSDTSIPPNIIAAFGGGGASSFTVAALQWCVSSIAAWVCDESVCGACCSCLQSIAASQSKTRPLDASLLQAVHPIFTTLTSASSLSRFPIDHISSAACSITSLLCSCNIGPSPLLSPLLTALASSLNPQAINSTPEAAAALDLLVLALDGCARGCSFRFVAA